MVLLLGATGLAQTDDSKKVAKIEEMLTLTRAEKMMHQMMDQMRPMFAAQMKQMNLPEEARPAIDEMQNRMMEIMAKALSWDKLKPTFVKIYAETLTEREIDASLNFYRTPEGQALLEKMPAIMQKSMMATQQMTAEVMPEIQKMVQETVAKYRK